MSGHAFIKAAFSCMGGMSEMSICSKKIHRLYPSKLKYSVSYAKSTEILVVVLAHSVLAVMTKNPQQLVVQCVQRVGWSELSSWHLSGCICGFSIMSHLKQS